MRCASCGQDNPERAKFCLECGTPLEGAARERRERRVVSVLVVDLQGFTSRSERLDVEDVDAFLTPYRDRLRRAVESTGGVVSDFAGDGMMAVFGAPVAHEDDAERAVRAAMAIRDSFLDPASPARAADLHVRLGVTSGEVLITLESGHVRATGDVVNTAARLEAAAPTDGVLVDAWTYRATSRAIHYDQVEPVLAKGKAEPVPAWVAVDPVSVLPEQQRDLISLVGRDAEAGALRGALDRSRREPSTQLVSVIGEPGIGKSRLVEELSAYVDELPELIVWRRGRSLAYGDGIAFWALGEIVKAQAGILESDSAAVAQEKLAAALAGVILDERDRAWVVRHLGPLVGLEAGAGGGDSGRVEAFAAWRRFVEALAESGPTVLVFEDIHWADDALLDFIDLVADRAGAVPLLIVCTARPELFERRAQWGGGKANATTISLRPLSDADTARLVGGLLDQALLPADVQRPLLARAGGNPLYAQEYVRMLQDRQLLVREAGGWALSGAVVDLPESLQGIIAARLDTLSPDEKTLLQDASVIGKTAWIGAVCALTERSAWQAEELLHGLERKQLVQRVRRTSIQGETEFQFGHALTRDVAYSQVRRADRAHKHEAAARWIEQLAGERDDKAELLADHYTQALALRRAIGEPTDAIAPRALAALTEAAHQAAATYAHAAAARHYEAALALTSAADARSRAALLLGHATALSSAGSVTADILEAAIHAQIVVEAWEAAAQIERMLGRWYLDSGDSAQADVYLAQARAHAALVEPGETMYMIASDEAYRLEVSGHPERALALANTMIPLADDASLAVCRALLIVWRGSARVELGDGGGVDEMREAAETLAEHAHPRTTAAYGNLADTLRGLGDMAAADAAWAEAARWASRFADLPYTVWIATEQAVQAYHAGRMDTAEALIAGIIPTNTLDEAYMCTPRGRIHLARSDVDRALADAALMTAYGTGASNDQLLCEGIALEARCLHAQQRAGDARDACDHYVAHWHESGGMTGLSPTLGEVACILVAQDRHEDIREAASLLPDICHWRRAILLTADRRYAEAADLYDHLGSRPLTADAHLLAAQRAAAEGRTSDATRHAHAISAFAKHTGAVLYQRQAERLIAASA
jgi:class 3 adenylate cyclase